MRNGSELKMSRSILKSFESGRTIKHGTFTTTAASLCIDIREPDSGFVALSFIAEKPQDVRVGGYGVGVNILSIFVVGFIDFFAFKKNRAVVSRFAARVLHLLYARPQSDWQCVKSLQIQAVKPASAFNWSSTISEEIANNLI